MKNRFRTMLGVAIILSIIVSLNVFAEDEDLFKCPEGNNVFVKEFDASLGGSELGWMSILSVDPEYSPLGEVENVEDSPKCNFLVKYDDGSVDWQTVPCYWQPIYDEENFVIDFIQEVPQEVPLPDAICITINYGELENAEWIISRPNKWEVNEKIAGIPIIVDMRGPDGQKVNVKMLEGSEAMFNVPFEDGEDWEPEGPMPAMTFKAPVGSILDLRIAGLKVEGFPGDGIMVINGVLLMDSVSMNNQGNGVTITGEGGEFINVTSMLNAGHGFFIHDAKNVGLEGIISSYNSGSGIFIQNSSGVKIKDSEVINNEGFGIAADENSAGIVVENSVVAGNESGNFKGAIEQYGNTEVCTEKYHDEYGICILNDCEGYDYIGECLSECPDGTEPDIDGLKICRIRSSNTFIKGLTVDVAMGGGGGCGCTMANSQSPVKDALVLLIMLAITSLLVFKKRFNQKNTAEITEQGE
ncbi:right-handed parallel beta-helix repeat-containing protein [bacterium]|nr:right-handed parallel beta-helix repeat-containing protein [bacterium]